MRKNLLALLMIAALAAGCGGGGGSSGAVIPQLPAASRVLVADAQLAPVVALDNALHVGPDVAPTASALSGAGTRAGVSFSSGQVTDGVGQSRVVEFLETPIGTSEDAPGLATFNAVPTVHLAEGTSDVHIGYVVRAVQLINVHLPRDKRISISTAPVPHLTTLQNVPAGKIYVNFAPKSTWNAYEPPSVMVVGLTESINLLRTGPDPQTLRKVKARILVDSTGTQQFSEEQIIFVVAHELVHAIGFSGHVDAAQFSASLMRAVVPAQVSDHILGPIDGEGLLAMYGWLEPGDTDAESLGSWSDSSFHLRGGVGLTNGSVAFGVASRNGLARPWATGPTPAVNLADNAVLSGSATWNGALLGMTPTKQTVAGDAALSIDLGSLQGDLDFTGLEHWGVHAAPGASGTGTMWLDGDLGYTVEVRGNTFARIGGDEGVITGAFFGSAHEGMGGVLERSDLTAAFGGKR